MAEYIEREALLNEAKKRAKAFSSVLIYEAIKEAPAADVDEVKHGEYVQKGAWHLECSVCGNILAHIGEEKNYCPNCGAKMDGERRAEE